MPRDALTATAHFQVNEASRERPGRILLGQPSEAAMLVMLLIEAVLAVPVGLAGSAGDGDRRGRRSPPESPGCWFGFTATFDAFAMATAI